MAAEPGAAKSEVDKITELSGRWNGFSQPADPNKGNTSWADTTINFNEDPLYPGMLKISGRGSSVLQGEPIQFGLSGVVDSSTGVFQLFKAHTGRFVHTIAYDGIIYPNADPPTMNGGFSSKDQFGEPSRGSIELKKGDPNQPGSRGGSRKTRQRSCRNLKTCKTRRTRRTRRKHRR